MNTFPAPRRTRRILIAAVVVMALLVLVFVLQQRSPQVGPQASGPATAPLTGSTSAATTASTPASQASSSYDPSGLTAPPSGITWTLFRGLALPQSAAAGPTRISGPVYAGYAHTPTGALIAAEQIAIRAGYTPGDGWRQVLDQQVMDTPGRTQFETVRSQIGDSAPGRGWAQFSAFKFVTYTPEITVISLAAKNNSGSYNVSDVTMQWSGGDWKLQIPASGSVGSQQVQDVSTYVPFAGVS